MLANILQALARALFDAVLSAIGLGLSRPDIVTGDPDPVLDQLKATENEELLGRYGGIL